MFEALIKAKRGSRKLTYKYVRSQPWAQSTNNIPLTEGEPSHLLWRWFVKTWMNLRESTCTWLKKEENFRNRQPSRMNKFKKIQLSSYYIGSWKKQIKIYKILSSPPKWRKQFQISQVSKKNKKFPPCIAHAPKFPLKIHLHNSYTKIFIAFSPRRNKSYKIPSLF